MQPRKNIVKTPYVVGVCLHKKPMTSEIGMKKKYLFSRFFTPKINKQNDVKTKIVEWWSTNGTPTLGYINKENIKV